MNNDVSSITIAVTGYSGFIGSRLVQQLDGKDLLLLGRSPLVDSAAGRHFFLDLKDEFEIEDVLKGVDVLIHTAANAQSMASNIQDSNSYQALNKDATERLVMQAAKAGVKRFIFISSIKVNGESTGKNEIFTHVSLPKPSDEYALSKLHGELALQNIAEKFGMEWVIIRPPLVYGPGVKGNFEKLLLLATKQIPLPFSLVHNVRSMVYLDNLVDLIVCCVESTKAANKIFLVSDNDDLSLKGIISSVRFELNRSAMIFPFPISGFKMFGYVFGKQEIVTRLFDSLQVDISYTTETLDWKPPYTAQQGLKYTVEDFQHRSE